MATVHITGIDNANTYSLNFEMTDDLPADYLGSAVAEIIQKNWKSGCDPVRDNLVVVLHFSK